jgi:hypothetical protein
MGENFKTFSSVFSVASVVKPDGLRIALDLPDPWQREAVGFLREGFSVVIDAPTGAGKTRIFEMFVETPAARRLGQLVYTVPTRALANDKWREWSAKGWNVGIATGDIAENLDAGILVATLETQRERLLAGRAPGFLVLDEYQMLGDPVRGLNYEMAIALAPPETQLLLLSGSVANPQEILEWLRRLGRQAELLRVTERPVPLDEIPVENLPRVPASITGLWPRIAAAAKMGGLTPLLLFAPVRSQAEKMAQQIAAALPMPRPLSIPPEADAALGKILASLVRRRVAFHHSGLPHAARAQWIEPLGKAGELDVIVATTGLAAGINFSMRSVAVTSTTYGDARFRRQLRADELLQMFGRAGRRGLDEQGFAITTRDTPGLLEAAPLRLRRVHPIDWPTLLRIMETASDGPPLSRAVEFCERLFSKQKLAPDLADSIVSSRSNERLAPKRLEFLTPSGEWIPANRFQKTSAPLSQCLVHHKDRWLPALRVAASVENFPEGRTCRIEQEGGFVYGREVAVANGALGEFRPMPWIQNRLGLDPLERFSEEAIASQVVPLVADRWNPAKFHSTVLRGFTLMARLAFEDWPAEARVAEGHPPLIDPPSRSALMLPAEASFDPPTGSAAFVWKSLGLVDAGGRPTARGRVFSRFQNGEGLMVAAALENVSYPVEDLVQHLANLRGGPRFLDFSDGPSLRLAASAREVYGHVDHEGYLEGGLCPGFGEGTCEALTIHRAGGMRAIEKETELLRRGDLERAMLEWQSLLRHIVAAPDPQAPRWDELRAAAGKALSTFPATVRKS